MSAIEVRELDSRTEDVSKGHNLKVSKTDEAKTHWVGELSIEYRPRRFVVDENTLDALRGDVLDESRNAEEYIVEVYDVLVDELYPGYSGRDKSWEVTPMVVDFHYSTSPPWDGDDHYASLGSYR